MLSCLRTGARFMSRIVLEAFFKCEPIQRRESGRRDLLRAGDLGPGISTRSEKFLEAPGTRPYLDLHQYARSWDRAA